MVGGDYYRFKLIGTFRVHAASQAVIRLPRNVAKKKFSWLRYPLSRLTLEGACAFCVGAADTGGGYGKGWPPPFGGVRGASPGKF